MSPVTALTAPKDITSHPTSASAVRLSPTVSAARPQTAPIALSALLDSTTIWEPAPPALTLAVFHALLHISAKR